MIKSVGIIGFGRFGQLSAKYLKRYFRVYVNDCFNKKIEAKDMGVFFSSFEKCATQDVVLLCVPISEFEDIVKKLVPFIKKESLVIDVCSVKEKPVKIMRQVLPKKCECIGTHPLFGPDTDEDGLNGKKIVLCPIRTNRLTQIKKFLSEIGLQIIVSNPVNHDKQMANSLSLIHLLGRGLTSVGVKPVEMVTPTHDMFLELIRIVRNDSEKLFEDMQVYNRFAEKTRKILIKELIKIDGELDAKKLY